MGNGFKHNISPMPTVLDDNFLKQTLAANAKKPFVQRIRRTDNYKPLDMGNGETRTHFMEYGERDGKFFVYPTVLMSPDGTLKQFSSDEAQMHSIATGNIINFDSEEQAAFFSKHYKRFFDKKVD